MNSQNLPAGNDLSIGFNTADILRARLKEKRARDLDALAHALGFDIRSMPQRRYQSHTGHPVSFMHLEFQNGINNLQFSSSHALNIADISADQLIGHLQQTATAGGLPIILQLSRQNMFEAVTYFFHVTRGAESSDKPWTIVTQKCDMDEHPKKTGHLQASDAELNVAFFNWFTDAGQLEKKEILALASPPKALTDTPKPAKQKRRFGIFSL